MNNKAGTGRANRSMWDETPSGSVNKRKASKKINIRSVAAVLEERGLEPIGAICDVLGRLEPSMQARTLLSLAEFVYPKLGRTELTGPNGGAVQVGVKFEVVGVIPTP